jgi:hypothetical protein
MRFVVGSVLMHYLPGAGEDGIFSGDWVDGPTIPAEMFEMASLTADCGERFS